MEENKKNYLSEEQVKELLAKAKAGDNEAWDAVIKNFDDYIYSIIHKFLAYKDLAKSLSDEDIEELFQTGRIGLLSALRNYSDEKIKITTYAYKWIRGEIYREYNRICNFGLNTSLEAMQEAGMESLTMLLEKEAEEFDREFPEDSEVQDLGKYNPERTVLQVVYLIKRMTDENHSLSHVQLENILRFYRMKKYHNSSETEAKNTFNKIIAEMLLETNPGQYNGNNDEAFQIFYDGYRDNILRNKKDIMQDGNPSRVDSNKAFTIQGLQYNHLFSYAELDELIQAISFSELFSENEKSKLIGKLVNSTSVYYSSPFYDNGKMKFNPSGIHGRFSKRKPKDRKKLYENLRMLQEAIRLGAQIEFKYNQYNAEHRQILRNDALRILSPYHIVVYHDNFFCIGLNQAKKDLMDERIWHYRVDLMSDLKIRRDEKGKVILIRLADFEGTPICNAQWNPEKYMSEHMNMGYGAPEIFRIKIPKDGYTILQDWFGDYYEKTGEECEKGYDIVKIKTSRFMIVKWALQYGDYVELMDEEARENVREELRKLGEKYGNT